jgi:hypothetical protein
MIFRLKTFGLHLLASTVALALIFGTLYFGWYRWPGWYLADVSHVVLVMAGVDIVVGPLLTFTLASPRKPRKELIRDIMMIVIVQLCALGYGTISLWHGRPLYYAFSENELQMVQAYDIDPQEVLLAHQQKSEFVPHWYSLPRWIWAPLPQDSDVSSKIVASAIFGGDDVTSMPRYFKRWELGVPALRTQLKKLDDQKYFLGPEKKRLKERMQAAGVATDQPDTIPMTGRSRPLLIVFDPASMRVTSIFKAS